MATKSQHRADEEPMKILLTGATGYVGSCLLPELERRGASLRALTRRPGKLVGSIAATTEILEGDASDPAALDRACAGIDIAYWLVHSMESGADFERADRLAAERFAEAARKAGVQRIIYLGGLGAEDELLSAHLRSRQEVGAILRASGLDVVEFRASIIIGAGSFSFDLVRTLVERLPVMVCPAWAATITQPIAITDVVEYLTAASALPPGESRIFEIGGPDKVSYRAIMQEYARQRGLMRLMIPVPVLTPRLSSLWLTLVAPQFAKVGRELIDGLKNRTVVTNNAAAGAFVLQPRTLRKAIYEAGLQEDTSFTGKRWADLEAMPARYGGKALGTRLVDHRHIVVSVSAERAFAAIERIGGTNGWYGYNWLWAVRGWLDRCIGGPGMSRGRCDSKRLSPGEKFDCWHVEICDRPRRLRLAAEMKLPGRGWLEFEVVPRDGDVTIHQTAVFDPKGLGGLAYWYAIWPLHELIFRNMLIGIARAAVRDCA